MLVHIKRIRLLGEVIGSNDPACFGIDIFFLSAYIQRGRRRKGHKTGHTLLLQGWRQASNHLGRPQPLEVVSSSF